MRRPGDQRRTLAGLGLGRIGRVATVDDTPAICGMISKVRRLVRAWHVSALTDSIEAQLETLGRFNRRVARVEAMRFWRRYKDEEPHAVMWLEKMDVESTGPHDVDEPGADLAANFRDTNPAGFVFDQKSSSHPNAFSNSPSN